MIQKLDKACCGCGLCSQICPKEAITMQEDAEGFLYPQVNEELCVSCGLCVKCCPIESPPKMNKSERVLGVKHINTEVRQISTSGGVFTALSDAVLTGGGVVYGAVLDAQWRAMHSRAETQDQRNAMRGSKYMQSYLGETFLQLRKDVLEEKTVLFTGTPCQCAAISNFLKKERLREDQVILTEILCTGVNSPRFWQDYCTFLEEKEKDNILDVQFRSKDSGWTRETIRIEMQNKVYKNGFEKDPFCQCFAESLIIRPSCYSCQYAREDRSADITIGDFWAYSKLPEVFRDDRGISMVLINTMKGKQLWERTVGQVETCESDLETAVSRQAPLKHPVWRNRNRDAFWRCYHNKGIEATLRKYTDYGTISRWMRKLKKYARRVGRGNKMIAIATKKMRKENEN